MSGTFTAIKKPSTITTSNCAGLVVGIVGTEMGGIITSFGGRTSDRHYTVVMFDGSQSRRYPSKKLEILGRTGPSAAPGKAAAWDLLYTVVASIHGHSKVALEVPISFVWNTPK